MDNIQPSRPGLPQEIRDVLRQIDTQRLFNELVQDGVLSVQEIPIFRKKFTSFLELVWIDRNSGVETFLPATVQPELRRAALWRVEELVLAPLTEKLKDAGLGNDAVLFQTGDFALTAARLDTHATDRITVKGERVVHHRRLLRKTEVVHEVELNVEYPEKEGGHESRVIEFNSAEEVRQFTAALEKARMVGFFNRFLEKVRKLV
jgi:hypothetical protein